MAEEHTREVTSPSVEEGKQEVYRDPALNPANEHHHAHHSHTAFAEKGRVDEVVYTEGTTAEKSNIPEPSPQDHSAYPEKSKELSDVEDLGEGRASRPWQRRLINQWRHVAYAVVWLLFTG
jgi:CNT family concentrative nucleoside transporter